MPGRFDLRSRLAPPKPQGEAFPPSSIATLQDMSAKRRQVTVEVLRPSVVTDETGGQSGGYSLAGQLSAWIQEFSSADEQTPTIGGQTQTKRGYFVGVPHDADVRNSDQLASPGWANEWTPATTVSVGDVVIPTDDKHTHIYECVYSGQTGNIEPFWPLVIGAESVDGFCHWKNAGEVIYLQVKGDDKAKSTPAEKVLVCEVVE